MGFTNSVLSLSAYENVRRYISITKQKKQQEKYKELARLREQEILKRVPSNTIPEFNEYNYQFAFELEKLCNYIHEHYDSISADKGERFYKGNRCANYGVPWISIVNNDVPNDLIIKIGDTIEKLYNTLGGLEYNLGNEYLGTEYNLGNTPDFVHYYIDKRIDSHTVLQYGITVIIQDKKITAIEGHFEGYHSEMDSLLEE